MKQLRVFLLMAMTLTATTLVAEEWLLKGAGKYLGKKSGDLFVTCHRGRTPIGNGSVVRTDDRCSESIVGPITGTIRHLSDDLVVNDSNGNEITFQLTAKEREALASVRRGSNVTVTFEHGTRLISAK
jgi:hypothetical protein